MFVIRIVFVKSTVTQGLRAKQRQQIAAMQSKFLGSERSRTANIKTAKMPQSNRKEISLLEAFTIGVFQNWCRCRKLTTWESIRWKPLTIIMVIPLAVLRVSYLTHLVPSLLDAVSGSHAVQPVDPISVLTVPWGHNAIPAIWWSDFDSGAWQAFRWTKWHRSWQVLPT